MAEDDEHMSDASQEEDENITNQKNINEEYKVWKKNAPFLYDMILSTALAWPTLTLQWFPDATKLPSVPGYSRHRLLLGTHTTAPACNYIQIAHVHLPDPPRPKPDVKDYDPSTGEIGGHGAYGNKNGEGLRGRVDVKFEITQKIQHPGEVNKARYCPHNPDLIATLATDGRCLIWDRTKHKSNIHDVPKGHDATKPPLDEPEIECIGHTAESWGLCWSPHTDGHLATASEDSTVRLWDIKTATKESRQIESLRTYTHHSGIVNDVQYHPVHTSLLGSVSDDLTLQIIDLRSPSSTTSALTAGDSGHTDAINTLSFSPSASTLLATGSSDRTIALWDLRSLSHPLHSLIGHTSAVTSLEWHPFEESILASSSYDRRILFWDLARVGEEQTPEDSEDGPPELLFMHGGHTNRVSEISWNKHVPWVMASAADDNMVQVWRVSEGIVGGEEDDVEMDQLEG